MFRIVEASALAAQDLYGLCRCQSGLGFRAVLKDRVRPCIREKAPVIRRSDFGKPASKHPPSKNFEILIGGSPGVVFAGLAGCFPRKNGAGLATVVHVPGS